MNIESHTREIVQRKKIVTCNSALSLSICDQNSVHITIINIYMYVHVHLSVHVLSVSLMTCRYMALIPLRLTAAVLEPKGPRLRAVPRFALAANMFVNGFS